MFQHKPNWQRISWNFQNRRAAQCAPLNFVIQSDAARSKLKIAADAVVQ